jgi:hypothetical protein
LEVQERLREIPKEVAEKELSFLAPDKVARVVHGKNMEKANVNDSLKVVSTSLEDPRFRSPLFMKLNGSLGEYAKRNTSICAVTEEDLKLFEKISE